MRDDEIGLIEGTFDALLFDCDGTLVNTGPLHFASLRAAMRQLQLDMAPDWYYPRIGLSPKDLLDAYEAEVAVLPESRSDLQKRYAAHYVENLSTLEEIAVVADTARRWKGRVPMAVVSNGHTSIVDSTLRVTGLLPLFDTVVCAEDVAVGKPAPDPYLAAASRLKVEAVRCVVLEDSDEGLASAKAAGMRGVDIRKYFVAEYS